MKSIYRGEHAPCLNCSREIKSITCHAVCPEYIDYQKRREKDRKDRMKSADISEERYFATRRKGR